MVDLIFDINLGKKAFIGINSIFWVIKKLKIEN